MGTSLELEINGKKYSVAYPPDTPLLYVLRDELGLTGTKYGCGEGTCGACTVLIAGTARRSCQMPVSAAVSKSITTIEGLERNGRLHPVQEAFLKHEAMQCGYCTPGMIMAGVAFLTANPNPTDAAIVAAMDKSRNMCRCGTYPRIVAALMEAAHGHI